MKQHKNWSYELLVAPEYSVSKHQFNNMLLMESANAESHSEINNQYLYEKKIIGFGLNFGGIIRYSILKPFNSYALISVGPMINSTSTERLANGFSFVDVFSLGLSYRLNRISLDFRYGIRHLSNLNIQNPNAGHNSTILKFGTTFHF
ncbi:acyloxyacyl hydrolase [Christiangramia salexigens]|nr:acyloxyacyl hydrolase [Christiangramia salexigens]